LEEQYNADKVDIVVEDPSALDGATYIITGFYGLGFCGYLTTKFLYDAAYSRGKTRRFGIIWSNSLPPVVEVDDTGKFRYPIEIHRIGANASVLLFRYQPSMSMQVGIADVITALAKEKGMTLILCGGIDINAFPEERRDDADVVYVCNGPFEEKYIVNGRWEVDKSPPEVVVSGGIALILMYADRREVPAVSLLTPTIARTGYLDYRASLKLAKRIVRMFELDIELSSIEEKVQMIEAQQVMRIIEKRERGRRLDEFEEHEEFGIT